MSLGHDISTCTCKIVLMNYYGMYGSYLGFHSWGFAGNSPFAVLISLLPVVVNEFIAWGNNDLHRHSGPEITVTFDIELTIVCSEGSSRCEVSVIMVEVG